MPTYAVFFNEKKESLLGSDSFITIDGRLNKRSAIYDVKAYRENYRKGFPNKYKSMVYIRLGKGENLRDMRFITGFIDITQ